MSIRSVIQLQRAKGIAPIQFHDELEAVFSLNIMTVQYKSKWCHEFLADLVSATEGKFLHQMYVTEPYGRRHYFITGTI